jgi:hypothetical protein
MTLTKEEYMQALQHLTGEMLSPSDADTESEIEDKQDFMSDVGGCVTIGQIVYLLNDWYRTTPWTVVRVLMEAAVRGAPDIDPREFEVERRMR